MQIPSHLLKDRYWKGTLFLFMKHSKLQSCLTTKYFDFEGENVDVAALKRLAKPWGQSERFILSLALHLFNESLSKVNLSDMDSLDDQNKALAIEAIRLRYI